ncbi:hypothetical protein C4K04_2715 [Pseudomonas chlororaphis]|uniref:Uncharacterized protein n=1 Tax=Pseudomonas chlororaphis TaxID=587753 RepID=A0A3G7TMP1_9PSED|nr:hypothetical protein [Pseudomonas chlororaphis]AZE48387.1 hypothetical protein C4K04_2715 [Pseudomonas chlororaphis]
MSTTKTLTVLPGQLALVLSNDGVNALARYEQVRAVALSTDATDASYARVSGALSQAADSLALHVRAAADLAREG